MELTDAIAWAVVVLSMACEAVGLVAIIGLFLPIRPRGVFMPPVLPD